jgi:hypothetical protein
MRIFFVMLGVVVLLSGCADTFSRQRVELTLVKGSTTRQEVLDFFGKPSGKYTNPGMKMTAGGKEQVLNPSFEVWLYSPHETRLADLLESESLRIIFNEAGIVTGYEYKDDGD